MSDLSELSILKQEMYKCLEEFHGIVTPAAEKCGIARKTHYEWMKTDPVYAAAVKELRNTWLDLAELTLRKNMKSGDGSAAAFIIRYMSP